MTAKNSDTNKVKRALYIAACLPKYLPNKPIHKLDIKLEKIIYKYMLLLFLYIYYLNINAYIEIIQHLHKIIKIARICNNKYIKTISLST
jgi:hypothetical protein